MNQIGIALEMRGVSKLYPGTLAVDCVDLSVSAGEVHALIGENGAGKSTLMKMLAGSFTDYTGQIFINSQPVTLRNPSAARAVGIGMIHQELSLAGPLSVAENILAGRLPSRRIFLDRGKMLAKARSSLAKVGLDIDPELPVEELSLHEAQLVEIAKVLDSRPCILVMDEPTSALSRDETDRLFDIIRKLRNQGLAIVYISHHLPDVFSLADRVTVMRDGRKVATRPIGEVTQSQLIEMMVGRAAEDLYYEKKQRTHGPEKFAVERLTRRGFFHDVSFRLRAGEILGIGGLAGAGRTELARSIVGLDPVDSGRVTVDGRTVRVRGMGDAVRTGLAYLPENRKAEGLALRLSSGENLLSALLPRLGRFGFHFGSRGADTRDRLLNALQVNPPDPSVLVRNLSGGNQQKVLLAKWMAVEPKVLILDEPTRGVDIGAKVAIHRTVDELARRGHAVILISSDLPELVTLADRVLVMRRGRIAGELSGKDVTEETVLLAANGGLTNG